MTTVFRRCGCRDVNGKTYGVLPEKPTAEQQTKACPKMLTDPKHGRWSFRLSAGFDPITKKRRQVNGRTYATKGEARKARTAAAAKVDQGKILRPSTQRYAEYLPAWLERRQKSTAKGKKPLSANTVENYRRYIEQDIAPSALGTMKLQDIRRHHVQAFVEQLIDAGRGAVTIRRIVAVVQGSLSGAVREELVEDNPARDLDLPIVPTKEVVPWEPDQVGHFLDTAAQHRLGALFEVAMFTGMRRGELIGLRWDDVDLERREVWVRNNLTHTGDGDTKSKAGRRRVALDDYAAGALIGWQVAQATERASWEAAGVPWLQTGYVFTMEDGRPLKPQYATRLFDKLRTQAGLPKVAEDGAKAFTFHGQRHQSASLLLASGADLTTVQKRLGHSNGAVTSDTYSHLLRSRDHEVANQASALVPRRGVAQAPGEQAGAHTLHTREPQEASEAAPASSGNGL